MANLADDKVKAAWEHLRAWHKEVDPAASKPCRQALDRQTQDRVDLYRRRDPPGAPIPSNARRTPRADHPPTDEELRLATKKSRNGRTGGASKMRAEDLKEWLRGMEDEERAAKKGESGFKGAGDRWRLLLRLC